MVRRTRFPVAGSRPISRTASHFPHRRSAGRSTLRRDLADFPTPLPRAGGSRHISAPRQGTQPSPRNLSTVQRRSRCRRQRVVVRGRRVGCRARRLDVGLAESSQATDAGVERSGPGSESACRCRNSLAPALGALRACGHTGGYSPLLNAVLRVRSQGVGATASANFSDVVMNPRVLRGRPLSSSAMASRSSWV
jgi:hypothetical protein